MKKMLIGIAVAAACNQALAETYVGVGAGAGNVSYDHKISGLEYDKKAESFKFLAGYSFNRYFSLELGYQHFDNFAVAAPAPFTERADFSGYATYFDAIGSYPLSENFSLFGRLGLAATTLESDSNVPDSNLAMHETGPRAGLGLQYNFAKNFGARLEWERTFKLGNSSETNVPVMTELDIDVVGASLLYRF